MFPVFAVFSESTLRWIGDKASVIICREKHSIQTAEFWFYPLRFDSHWQSRNVLCRSACLQESRHLYHSGEIHTDFSSPHERATWVLIQTHLSLRERLYRLAAISIPSNQAMTNWRAPT
jgi:hypothetical protein